MTALQITDMVKYFRRGLLGRRAPQPAVDHVDLTVARGQVLGLIGESGSGKTTLARAALGLIPFDAGRVELLGVDLASLRGAQLRAFRKRVQLLFQNPDAHLNPGLTVRAILRESARLHRPQQPVDEVVSQTLEQVNLAERVDAWPAELSGGEKRRVGIARILIADPELVVADEPTAGLDAALKADILDLLLSRRGAERAYLLISHDIPLVAFSCDRIAVMLGGRVIEEMPVSALQANHHHPYTQTLLSAAGMAPPRAQAPPQSQPATGCPWLGACAVASPKCRSIRPPLTTLEPGHRVACHALMEAR